MSMSPFDAIFDVPHHIHCVNGRKSPGGAVCSLLCRTFLLSHARPFYRTRTFNGVESRARPLCLYSNVSPRVVTMALLERRD